MAPVGFHILNDHPHNIYMVSTTPANILPADDVTVTGNGILSTNSPLVSTILSGLASHIDNSVTKSNLFNNVHNVSKHTNFLPSNHPFLFPGNPNTPLTAPETDLFTVTDDYNYNPYGGLLGNRGPDTASLGWIIPTVIGIVAAMIILGLLCFFGVRALELKCMRCCEKNCSCCYRGGGEDRAILTSGDAINTTEMTNYKSAFTPDSGSW